MDGAPIDDEGADRVATVLDRVRERAGIETGARVVSENSFESNVGLGASASAFAALALATAMAAGLDLPRAEPTAERLDAPFDEAIRRPTAGSSGDTSTPASPGSTSPFAGCRSTAGSR